MDRQHSYRSPVLDHQGFVAGMIDQATPQHPEMGLVTAGHAVNAMVLHSPRLACHGSRGSQRP